MAPLPSPLRLVRPSSPFRPITHRRGHRQPQKHISRPSCTHRIQWSIHLEPQYFEQAIKFSQSNQRHYPRWHERRQQDQQIVGSQKRNIKKQRFQQQFDIPQHRQQKHCSNIQKAYHRQRLIIRIQQRKFLYFNQKQQFVIIRQKFFI